MLVGANDAFPVGRRGKMVEFVVVVCEPVDLVVVAAALRVVMAVGLGMAIVCPEPCS